LEKDLFLGRRAVERGYVSAKDLLGCLKMQVDAEAVLGKHLLVGELLFLRGLVDERQFRDLVAGTAFAGASTEAIPPAPLDAPAARPADARPKQPLLGEALIERGLATPEDVLRALDAQRLEDARGAPHRKLGEILIAENVVTPQDLESTLKLVLHRAQGEKPKPERPSQKG
jgi:hypothetical protein